MLDQIVFVLCRTQRAVNIGGAVRALKNMGLRQLRLVAPESYDPNVITSVAHRSDDLLANTTIYDTLDAALADMSYVVGTTARVRDVVTTTSTPRDLAPMLLERAAVGPVAILFGPEDHGLTNDDLDRCHIRLSIPTAPEYSSLNLAQAVLLVAYELRQAAQQPTNLPRPADPPANAAQLEAMFESIERALWGIEFFKNRQSEVPMRHLRTLLYRAEPSVREAGLLRAAFLEVLHFLRRKGIEPSEPPSKR
jgi:TrmH family RNA methyltransferase